MTQLIFLWVFRGVLAFSSDDFNGCESDPSVWTIVDPLGDSDDPSIIGAYSGDSQVGIPVADGRHIFFWNGTTNFMTAPHIRQTATNDNFALTVKFDGDFAANRARKGIVAFGENDEWVKFESAGTGTSVDMVSGSDQTSQFYSTDITYASPLYMRVVRSGNTWTQSYSSDGDNWTSGTPADYTITMNGIGLIAANDGGDEGYTLTVDYFEVAGDPLTLEDEGTTILP